MPSLTQLVCRASQGRGRVVGERFGTTYSMTFARPAALVGPITEARRVKQFSWICMRTHTSLRAPWRPTSGHGQAIVAPAQELVCCWTKRVGDAPR